MRYEFLRFEMDADKYDDYRAAQERRADMDID